MASEGLLTLDEAAAYLGVAKITLRRWTRDGHLVCVRIGKRGDRRFRRQDLDAYIERRRASSGKVFGKNRGGDGS
jgi:excisionase family DNA binding protein